MTQHRCEDTVPEKEKPIQTSTSAMRIIWRALSISQVYRLFRKLVGGDDLNAFYVREYVRARAGERVLDIGCGPGDILDFLPPVTYLGFDLNPAYIQSANKRFGTRGEFHQQIVTRELVGKLTGFDLVMANGVLHHLNDAECIDLFNIAVAALKPDGRLVTLDGVLTPTQSRLARYLVLRDRGRFVRTEEEYVRMARRVFPRVTARILDGRLRIPYTHNVLVCQK